MTILVIGVISDKGGLSPRSENTALTFCPVRNIKSLPFLPTEIISVSIFCSTMCSPANLFILLCRPPVRPRSGVIKIKVVFFTDSLLSSKGCIESSSCG